MSLSSKPYSDLKKRGDSCTLLLITQLIAWTAFSFAQRTGDSKECEKAKGEVAVIGGSVYMCVYVRNRASGRDREKVCECVCLCECLCLSMNVCMMCVFLSLSVSVCHL